MSGNYPIRDRSGMCLDPIWDECNHGSISRVDAHAIDELVLLCGVAESMSGN